MLQPVWHAQGMPKLTHPTSFADAHHELRVHIGRQPQPLPVALQPCPKPAGHACKNSRWPWPVHNQADICLYSRQAHPALNPATTRHHMHYRTCVKHRMLSQNLGIVSRSATALGAGATQPTGCACCFYAPVRAASTLSPGAGKQTAI